MHVSSLCFCDFQANFYELFKVVRKISSKSCAAGVNATLLFIFTSFSLIPVTPMYIFLHRVQVSSKITLAELHLKQSVMLTIAHLWVSLNG